MKHDRHFVVSFDTNEKWDGLIVTVYEPKPEARTYEVSKMKQNKKKHMKTGNSGEKHRFLITLTMVRDLMNTRDIIVNDGLTP